MILNIVKNNCVGLYKIKGYFRTEIFLDTHRIKICRPLLKVHLYFFIR